MAPTLDLAGWALMLGSWIAIGSLVTFCVCRVVKSRKSEPEPR